MWVLLDSNVLLQNCTQFMIKCHFNVIMNAIDNPFKLTRAAGSPGQRFTNVRILKNCVNFFVRTFQPIESVSLKFFRKNFRTNSVYLCANLRMVLGCRKSKILRNCHGGHNAFPPST